jgi:hypothetical protein
MINFHVKFVVLSSFGEESPPSTSAFPANHQSSNAPDQPSCHRNLRSRSGLRTSVNSVSNIVFWDVTPCRRLLLHELLADPDMHNT